jgi:hypothetical protein
MKANTLIKYPGSGVFEDWASRFSEELSRLGHHFEVVDISKE